MTWSPYKEETLHIFEFLSLLKNIEQFTIKLLLRKGLEEPKTKVIGFLSFNNLVSNFQCFSFSVSYND